MKIGIIGGGILGLTAAYKLSKSNYKVFLFEKEAELGGLSSTFRYKDLTIEKYHHFVSQADNYLIELLKELNLDNQLKWTNTELGYFSENKLIDFTTPLEMLQFPGLSIVSKIRFGASMYLLKFIKNWKSLEGISAKDWIIKYQGKDVYEKIWKHLIELKFKGYENDIPMSWLWSRSTRRIANRKNKTSLERFGYMKDSFSILINKLEEEIIKNGGIIFKETEVKNITTKNNLTKKIITSDKEYEFDKILVTSPLPIYLNFFKDLPETYKKNLQNIDYKSILNVSVITKQKLSKYFWLNISDPEISFPGVIEFGNINKKLFINKENVVYLPNYRNENDAYYNLTDEEIRKDTLKCLKKIYKNIDPKQIKKILIFKDKYADPLYNLNYSKKLPLFFTPYKNLFLCNTSQIYPETRSVNNSINFALKICRTIENE